MKLDEIRVGRWLTAHKKNPIVRGLLPQYVFTNPAYTQAKMNGMDTSGIEPKIKAYREVGDTLLLPRAAAHRFIGGAGVEIIDDTSAGQDVEIPSLIEPRDYQVDWIETFHEHLTTPGIFGGSGKASAGFGKTVCALELFSRLGRKTLIMVHKEFLMTQWAERILGTKEAAKRLKLPLAAFGDAIMDPMLGLDPDQVGFIQQDRFEWDRPVVIAMYQTLNARSYPKGFYESFGVVAVDETHRASAPTFQDAIVQFPATHRLGVTATPKRKDGLEGIFFGHIGDICVEGESPRKKPRVNQIATPVLSTPKQQSYLSRFRNKYTPIVSLLVKHEARNKQIVSLLYKAAKKGRKVLLLSDRRKHLDLLREMFLDVCREHEFPTTTAYYMGGMDLIDRKKAEKRDVLFATYQMAGEGLDIPALDTVFLATPRGPDMIEQFVGRILRLYEGKSHPVIVDFVDERLPMTKRMAHRRRTEYSKLGWL